jgi:hypothetical protein
MEHFKQVYGQMLAEKKNADQIATWMQQRYYWGDFLAGLRTALIRSEDDERKKLSAQKPGVEVGVWIESMNNAGAATPNGASAGMMAGGFAPAPFMRSRLMFQQPPPVADQSSQTGQASTNGLTLVCRAVSLKLQVDPSANNKEIAFTVRDQIANLPFVDPDAKATQLVGEISPDDANGTFTFTLNVTPLNPLKF